MENLRNLNSMSAEQQSTDSIVSHMLMGFIERKISPQTIADVLRAQIFESNVPANLLNIATCNGILEVLTSANSTEDCTDLIFYLSVHPEFPSQLSFKAAAGTLRVLLRFLQKNALQNNTTNHSSAEGIIEALAERILHFFHSRLPVDIEDKTSLTLLIKTTHPTLSKLMRNSPYFQHLRFMLVSPNDYMSESSLATVRPQPLEMFTIILKTSDEHLQLNGTSYYKTEPTKKGTSARIKHFYSMYEIYKTAQCSDFKTGFIIEWIFEKALVEVVLNEESIDEYIKLIKYVSLNLGMQMHIMRGLIRAIQKDFSFLCAHPIQKISEQKLYLYDKALALAQHIFPIIVTLAERDNNYVSKCIANWAVEMPLQNEDSRFFKRIHWRWIRTLSARIWDASLRTLPGWVTENASIYCAVIFQSAPALWLQEYSFPLLEQLYKETLLENFTPLPYHYDYVEFLIRAMRKKSPFFASRTESLYALHLLSRLTRSEAQQYTSAEARFQAQIKNYSPDSDISPEFSLWKEIILNLNIEETLGNNPITRALSVLARLSKETFKK